MSSADGAPGTLWRVFPWDPRSPAGARFSPSHIPDPTGRGRFDLPRHLSSVLYVAETPDHAVGEMLQPWRGQALKSAHLFRAGLPLAMVEVEVPDVITQTLADLCDPDYLAVIGTPPDLTASRHRERTHPIARAAWEGGYPGLRWWSSFWGEWHTVVLFKARVARQIRFGTPEVISTDHPAVLKAAALLGMSAV